MSSVRRLSKQERAVIVALLQAKPKALHLVQSLEDLLVEEMKDGGMGSLMLIPKGVQGIARSAGEQIELGEFVDSDGVAVSIALNLDRQGRLYELDVWKVNFGPLFSWPAPSAIRIVG
jgi:hypothetical protein